MSQERPDWIELWTTREHTSNVYDAGTISQMRAFAKTSPEIRTTMLNYPPHCVIRFNADGAPMYGIVTGVCMLDIDKPKKGEPRSKPALRFVPSPLHLAGATCAEERDAQYVTPRLVEILGYSPRYTPETMRAFIAPAGLA